MFHNIFKKLKPNNKKLKSKINPKIIIDIHEKNSLIISEIANNNIDLEIQPLKIGDYLIGSIIIERKTINDFISSMLNKRMIEQLKQMQKYQNRLLIIEGNQEVLYSDNLETKLNPNAVRGFILSIITNYNTNIIFTKNYQETSKFLIILARQIIKPKIEFSLHARIPKTIKEQKKYILESFPNIGQKKSEKLLKKFKTLKNIFNSSEEETKEILKSKAKDFKDLINS